MSYPGLEDLDVSGARVWQAIIHRPFEDLSGVVGLWSDKCGKMLVQQHSADTEVPRTHIHILIENPQVKKEALRRILKTCFPDLGRGDSMILELTKKTREPYKTSFLSRYILKGEDPSYNKGFTDDQINRIKLSWNTDVKSVEEKEKEKTHYQVCQDIYKIILESAYAQENTKVFDSTPKIVNKYKAAVVMNIELNRARIRTSQNELERFYVTIMRMDEMASKEILTSMVDKVFRKT